MSEANNIFGDYWRRDLGAEFRDKALEYIGCYAEKNGDVTVSDDKRHYTAVFSINDSMGTIFPLGLSCNMTYMETRFISKIVVEGRIKKGKHKGTHVIDNVSFLDIHGNKLDKETISIDSILYLLDFLDYKDDVV